MNSNFAQTLKIAKSMKLAYSEDMQEKIIIAKILWSVTTKFNYVVFSIEESNNIEAMTIDELQSSLLVHEQRMVLAMEEERVLQMVTSERNGRGKGRGRSSRGSFRGRGSGRQSFNKNEVECYKCHKLGNFHYECPTWEKNGNYAEVEDKVEQKDKLLIMASISLKEE